ncbi:unnamed protein product [Polarella glacialis]|uniref:Methyltransferase FkbM domain-containing protein n=1 Tax=Polarella glacialis TaxID=89957 RepID=A0A813GRF4_POLGL|nr:unnamed protein product [Polarella glacialis]
MRAHTFDQGASAKVSSCLTCISQGASRASAKALAFVYLNSGSDKSGSDDSGHNNSGPDSSGSDNAGSDNFGSDISGSNHSGSDFSGCAYTPTTSALTAIVPWIAVEIAAVEQFVLQGVALDLHAAGPSMLRKDRQPCRPAAGRSAWLAGPRWHGRQPALLQHCGHACVLEGIRRGAKIMGPSSTRFTIYIAGFLGQSIRHYRARYIAAASALETYDEILARRPQRQDVLDVCLHLPHGFIKTAQSSQAVAQVFFPIVLANVGVFWHLHFLGCYSAQLGRLRARLELQLVNDPDLQTFADTPAGHPQRVFRPARSWGTQALAAAGAPGVLANMRHRLDALGLRQPGAQPQPLEALLAMARIGAELAQHLVGWRNDGAQLGAVRSGWLEPKEWLAAIFAVLPAAVVLCGLFHGCSLSKFGVLQGSAEAWQSRRAVAAIRAADEVVPAVSKTMSYFAALAGKFEVTVLQSHGTHIPFEVRGAATLLFWAPDILANPVNANGSFELGDLAGMQLLGSVRQWVSKMIPTYYWPGDDVLLEQYRVLTRAWKQAVLDDLAVKADVWETRVDGTFAFCWPGFWKQAHVDSRFAPASASAARQLFHYTGSFGESECAAEGVGSILKFLASTSNLSPARVVGKTLMKFYGLAGDGSDDQFLERVWRSMGKCSFNFAHARARQCRYRLGHGSKTLRRMLKASAARKVKKGRTAIVKIVLLSSGHSCEESADAKLSLAALRASLQDHVVCACGCHCPFVNAIDVRCAGACVGILRMSSGQWLNSKISPAEIVRRFDFNANFSEQVYRRFHACIAKRAELPDWLGEGRPALLSGEHFPVSVVPSPRSPPLYWVTPAWDYVVSNFIRRDGTYEPSELNLFRSLVREGDVVCDLGSHVGSYAIPLASHVGLGGRVYAFEPFRLVFQLLMANVAINGLANVYGHNVAVGAQAEALTVRSPALSLSSNIGATSVFNQALPHYGIDHVLQYEGEEQVNVISFDSLELDRVDFMKIDVEGALAKARVGLSLRAGASSARTLDLRSQRALVAAQVACSSPRWARASSARHT